ncbi:GTP pyrophosphokinase [Flavobacterium nitrogenifigens]|uniref:PpGpp synthetase catalytic domain-containing protein (RelA/SpoT-type nucleotidyltranferase) n=1 Tax=Flavobacterium nitrogenifigens TaxID=1617283 RepID=A0A521EYE9_9FLAO|nr:hypothetical protein [Flavobacterium nitrogenifigens]KAF2336122.1 hypothetical protein DM397_06195 [Flavobacterium nitrogenifigens]SMO88978.1 ppGpp synthetase catalytic domain-containing protein (RelA/SpoT-type nucleotidyltranferase) [Flavobacterium nitrogenifigens]
MHKLTQQYKSAIKKYEDYKRKAENLILELLIQNNLNYHKIESRIKDISKLDEKIYRKDEKYSSLDEITDLVGVRVITYLEDDVDKVADIISKEFTLDHNNSIDKRMLDSDKFGYRSLHYVISLTNERKNLTEYKRFKDIKIELQIRSILQHAWAEIEHDIGYKSEQAIPTLFKRNFYRVAALLETADIEFVNIKKGLQNYETNIASSIERDPENVEINATSLKSFILSNKDVKEIDEKICEVSGCKLANHQNIDIENHVKRLLFLNIDTIKKLEEEIIENKEKIINFASEWLKDKIPGSFDKGISLFYLCYVLAGKSKDVEFANYYYSNTIDEEPNTKIGEEIIETYKRII